MARHTTPEFKLAPEDANQDGMQARATRLALFFDILTQSPERANILLKGYVSVTDVEQHLDAQPYNQISHGQAELEELPYDGQLTYATALILRHQDDMIAEPDPETAAAMRSEIASKERSQQPYDRRLTRLQVVAQQLTELNLSNVNLGRDAA